MNPPHRPRPVVPLRRALLRGFGMAALVAATLAGPSLAATPAASTGTSVQAAVAPAGVSGLTKIKGGFASPVFLTHAGDDRLFVVERAGRIRILRLVDGTWTITGTFLDIRSRVGSNGSEQGLLGLAFHPQYAANGRFYVDYTDNSGDTVVAEFKRKRKWKADPDSRRVVLTVNQPYSNHNGGWLGFRGPNLYIALGDGGSRDDPQGNGQDLGTRLGKILRINPTDPSGPRRYSVPADNPFVGKAGLDEIWAYGLRNPWRNSFDPETGDLWIGDVGQDRWEEIDHAGDAKGRNFGWRRVEGRHLRGTGTLCSSNCRTLPVVEYAHSSSQPCNSILGGYVARRSGADLEGRYLFADSCWGTIWDVSTDHDGGSIGSGFDTSLFLTSFGEDAEGRIYVLSSGGAVYRVNGT